MQDSEKVAQTATTYDQMYESGGSGESYLQHYRHSPYYPMFNAVYKELKRHGGGNILEVGCGNGQFAALLQDRAQWPYRGFDFSKVAVGMARNNTGLGEAIKVADATLADSYPDDFDTLVCTEVLEHVPEDLKAVSHWKPGTYCICSVPNFDSKYHERFFKDEAEVRERYGSLININRIRRVTKPYLGDRSLKKRLRAMYWCRNRPAELLMTMGIRSFASAGWFIFSGERR